MIVIDFEAEAVSKEAFIYSPIYRVRLTREQFDRLLEEMKDMLEETDWSQISDEVMEEYLGREDESETETNK